MCKRVSINAVVIVKDEALFPGCMSKFIRNCASVCSEYGARGYTVLLDNYDDDYELLVSEHDAEVLSQYEGEVYITHIENDRNGETIMAVYGDVEDDLNDNDVSLTVYAVAVVGA